MNTLHLQPNPTTPFAAVNCFAGCGLQRLTFAEYTKQLIRPWEPWSCPNCGAGAGYNDTESEALQKQATSEPS